MGNRDETGGTPPSDEALMAAYVAGDERALAELHRRYAPLLLARARRAADAVTDARDLVQQTFLQLHRARRDYRAGEPLRPWLMTIANNLVRDHLRRVRRRLRTLPLVTEPAAGDGRADQPAVAHEAVHHALARLSPSLGHVVRAYWLEHRSFASIAHELGISHGAAKVRAHRAYRQLRRILRAEGFESGGST